MSECPLQHCDDLCLISHQRKKHILLQLLLLLSCRVGNLVVQAVDSGASLVIVGTGGIGPMPSVDTSGPVRDHMFLQLVCNVSLSPKPRSFGIPRDS